MGCRGLFRIGACLRFFGPGMEPRIHRGDGRDRAPRTARRDERARIRLSVTRLDVWRAVLLVTDRNIRELPRPLHDLDRDEPCDCHRAQHLGVPPGPGRHENGRLRKAAVNIKLLCLCMRLFLRRRPYVCVPPLTWIIWPLMKAPSSAASRLTTAAISLGVPRRPTGMRDFCSWICFVILGSSCSDAMGPGEIRFVVTPCGPNSLASALV